VRTRMVVLTAVAVLWGSLTAHPQGAGDSLRVFVAEVNGRPGVFLGTAGVFLGTGVVLTSARVIDPGGSSVSVRLDDAQVSAKVIKTDSSDDVNLSLVSVKLSNSPLKVQMRRVQLCGTLPYVGEPVIVAGLETNLATTIASPMVLPPELRQKFATILAAEGNTENFGAGVYDAVKRCLLGIMSGKYSGSDWKIDESPEHAVSYFVPASTIRRFIPTWLRF
jgi:S1-C subfamily serine protease